MQDSCQGKIGRKRKLFLRVSSLKTKNFFTLFPLLRKILFFKGEKKGTFLYIREKKVKEGSKLCQFLRGREGLDKFVQLR